MTPESLQAEIEQLLRERDEFRESALMYAADLDVARRERDALWDATGIAHDRPVEFVTDAIENMVDTSQITRTQLRPQLARAEAEVMQLRATVDKWAKHGYATGQLNALRDGLIARNWIPADTDEVPSALRMVDDYVALASALEAGLKTAKADRERDSAEMERLRNLASQAARSLDRAAETEERLRAEIGRIADEYDAPPGVGYSGAQIAARLRAALAPGEPKPPITDPVELAAAYGIAWPADACPSCGGPIYDGQCYGAETCEDPKCTRACCASKRQGPVAVQQPGTGAN